MPPPVADDDHKRRARRRLIGAVALTVIAVIILPLVLEKEPPPAGPLDIHMPAMPVQSGQVAVQNSPARNTASQAPVAHGPVVPSTIEYAPPAENSRVDTSVSTPAATRHAEPAKVQIPKTQIAKAASPKTELVKTELPKTASPQLKPESSKPENNAAGSEPKHPKQPEATVSAESGKAGAEPAKPEQNPAAKVPAAPEAAFSVQVGVFADKANVEKTKTRIAALSLKAYTDQVGNSTRVRAGKFTSRAQAETAAAKLKAAGLPARVVEK